MLLYADSHRGFYPDSLQTLVRFNPSVRELLVCPYAPHGAIGDPNHPPADADMFFDDYYLARGVSTREGSETITLIERPYHHGVPRSPALFGDGSVDWINLFDQHRRPTKFWEAVDRQILSGIRPVRFPPAPTTQASR